MTRTWPPIKTNPWTLGIPLILMLWALHSLDVPQRLNLWLYDTLITASPTELSPDIALVAIDERSLDELGKWPWPRDLHASLIDKLDAAGAETIVFDILFAESSAEDATLASAMSAHGQVILPLHLSPPSSSRLMTEYMPVPLLADAARSLGHAHVELDEDGVARGLYLQNGIGNRLWPSLSLAVLNDSVVTLSDSDAAPYTNIRQQYRAIPLAGAAGTLPTYSYIDVLSYPPAYEEFQGKTVFVGATAAGFGDVLPTPFSGLRKPMSGVEFHANAYSALKNDQTIERSPSWLSYALAVLVLIGLSLALPRMRPTRSLVLCASSVITLILAQALLLFYGHYWLNVSYALVIAILANPLSSTLRLAMTNRFLNRQLDELASGPSMTLPKPSHRHPSQLMSHLRALLQPTGWIFAQQDEVIESAELSLTDAPTFSSPGLWAHRNNQSWVQITRNDTVYTLGLKLPNDLSREAIQRYLDKLPLMNTDLDIPVERPRENVSARIERVRKATSQMNQLQEFIYRSFESMPDGIIVTDELGVIRFANAHIEQWFDEPMPSLNGLPLTRLLDGHDPRDTTPWHETVSETLTLAQARTVDLQLGHQSFLIHFAPFALPDGNQRGIIANVSDISELREQQRQHREAIDFISHDVRSPLVSQLALIEQLKRNQGPVETAQLDQLGTLARRSYNLAEEFVQLARAEQLTETRFYECEFLAIVENARDSVSEQAAGKGIQLVLQGQEDLWLNGNAELLERAVINLITNAIQYSHPGSTVTVQAFQAGHEACLNVIDEGEGIAKDEIPYLFDRYRRQKSSELSGNHGTGLGLSFVSVVVEKHRGRIAVESALGEGTAFKLRLPIATHLN
ncbi:CHASE2 domain-containing protein [Marinobacter sp. CHS3-4]|uniref:CHASE2 domain-containing protein n=1 Tax=Marinobacter sp. CHS3-4 TaxID=3045174 RepID=UPI0024B53524|nr:CHASE2 domain-containing protein [Marinobacter sp. CHS3-4]MDI9245114.1 CHASE2 domain-containing protein [Marinobacter sp. CHS3-4]